MRVVQEIKFKNDVNGNPRHLFVVYNLENNKWVSNEVHVMGYKDISNFMQDGDIRLATIYNYLSYSKTIEQFR